MKIVVDCAHGASYHIAPHVFHELGADVVAIGNQPDGLNINLDCGATQPQALDQRGAREQGADLGLALDGDGDRLMMVDAAGTAYDGDQLLYVIARQSGRAAEVCSGGVVGTLMTNFGLEQALAAAVRPVRPRRGGRPLRAGGAACARLAARRRELRPHHLPGQAHHRRWHRLGAAGAARAAGQTAEPSSSLRAACSCIPRCWSTCASSAAPTFARTRWCRTRCARPRRRSRAAAECCCVPPAPSRSSGSWWKASPRTPVRGLANAIAETIRQQAAA